LGIASAVGQLLLIGIGDGDDWWKNSGGWSAHPHILGVFIRIIW